MKTEKQIIKAILSKCKRAGYKRVAINMSHSGIPDSITWGLNVHGNIFAWPDRNVGGWPAIWRIVEKLGIGYGCGNSHQHQIKNISGKYAFSYTKNGAWKDVSQVKGQDNV